MVDFLRRCPHLGEDHRATVWVRKHDERSQATSWVTADYPAGAGIPNVLLHGRWQFAIGKRSSVDDAPTAGEVGSLADHLPRAHGPLPAHIRWSKLCLGRGWPVKDVSPLS